jgi:hypothetical protein
VLLHFWGKREVLANVGQFIKKRERDCSTALDVRKSTNESNEYTFK